MDEKKPDDPRAARKKAFALFRAAGIKSRADRLRFCAAVTGRTLSSSLELSPLEVGQVITALQAGITEDKSEPPSRAW